MTPDGHGLSPTGAELLDRRHFLARTGSGLAGIALASLLGEQGLLGRGGDAPRIDPVNPVEPRPPHFAPRAKNVVVLFCSGAISHLDTFDYKPELVRRHGEPMPGNKDLVTFQGENGALTKPVYPFRPRGESGKPVSDLVGHIGEMADDICFIHSMTSETNTHGPGENFMSTGHTVEGFPSAGAWVTYALGSESHNLPAFVALPDPRGVPQSSGNNWGSGFLPAAFQGTAFNAQRPIRNLRPPAAVEKDANAATRDLLNRLNDRHLDSYPGNSELAARIASYELSARMQMAVPEVTDLSDERPSTLRLYGADDSKNKLKAGFARNCILTRRLIERGVRFVQLFNGAYAMGEGVGNWDGHKKLKKQYDVHGPILDQPAAALLKDLKQRGLLEDTLVVFCTEFGRMPTFQKGASGRDHNPKGFTCWLAGAGVRTPYTHGATDALGHKAAEQVTSVYDLHATVLHLLGLDHKALTYQHNGTERRLTNVHGHVVRDVLA